MRHLHVHTGRGSRLDSTIKPSQLPKRAKELGMDSIAVTDHGDTNSLIDFYIACKEEGVKPILGVELYVCDDMKVKDSDSRYDHLVILAKNEIGYGNLLKLSSIGYTQGFYYKPRVDYKTLVEHKEGLVILTACLGGEIPRFISKRKKLIEKADAEAREKIMKSIEDKILDFAKPFEDFYLEVQSADNEDQEFVNKILAEVSDRTGLPIVVTSDAHFLKKEGFKAHGIFIQINQDRDNEFYQDCWVKSEEEVYEVLANHIGFDKTFEAVLNTHVIADMCNVEIELGTHYLPDFPIPKKFSSDVEYLRYLINKGFRDRGLNKLSKEQQQIYINRAKMEFDVITAKEYTGYFLIVQDFLERCRVANILTGDGRGSADNCLVCYLLHITNVDPIMYDLDFSRFLTMERTELPDVDMDIQSSRKQDAVTILREVYGYENVAQICTFGGLQAKAILEAVGKVLKIDNKIIAKMKKCIPDGYTLEQALEKSATLQIFKGDEKYTELFELSLELEGLERSISVHAGGVVICPSSKKITDFTALALSKDGEIITQLEMHNVEQVGLVKMDCLGIATLDVISDTLDAIYGEE